MTRLRTKLSYSNVISTLCLFLLIGGGTAFAASQLEKESVGTNQLKKGAVTPVKLSKAAKSTLAGPAGPKGATGATGATGPQGLKGDTGAAGSAVAYARIEENGLVDLSKSKNVVSANVTHPAVGAYCFRGLPFTPQNAVASPQFFEPKPVTIAVFMGAYEECPPDTQVSVQMMQEGNTGRNSPFTILFN
jgi:hypothetical protein